MFQKYTYRAGSQTVDTNASGFIQAATDAQVVDISDLENVSVLLNQIVDGGTATIKIDVSYDGTNWVPAVASKADTDFAAGANNTVSAYTLSDANGMAIRAKQVRARCSAATAGGSYSMGVSGKQASGYSG